jgi:GNAT superfamily N-acetyltransferase
MSPVSIRLAENRHLAEIPKIELAAATMFPEADLPQSIRHRVTELHDLQDALAHKRLWIAWHGEKPVGFAMASIVDGVGYLDELAVLPDFGRQGLGTRLVSTVIDWAGAEEFACLTLITFRHLAWNAPFYEKLGFKAMDSVEHGRELAGLMEDEYRIGLNISNRIAMRLVL